MPEGASVMRRPPCPHPAQFRYRNGSLVLTPCSWCAGFEPSPPVARASLETGWHEEVTTPYLAALARLRQAANREMDAVQVGAPTDSTLSETWLALLEHRLTYMRHLAGHAEGGPQQ